MITPLIINGDYILLSLSHEGSFESFEFTSYLSYSREKTSAMADNSFICKNTFIYLKYYNSINYVLNAFVGKGRNRLYIQKLFFKHYNLTKYKPKSYNETVIESALSTSPVTCFEIEELVECLYANIYKLYSIFFLFLFILSLELSGFL